MDKIAYINKQMTVLDIPYEFMEWTQKVVYPYTVGEYSEVVNSGTDGYEESTFMLTVTHRGAWIDLERIKEKIKRHFPPVGGRYGKTKNGAIAVFYANAFPVPTGDADLKRLQINLSIHEWKV